MLPLRSLRSRLLMAAIATLAPIALAPAGAQTSRPSQPPGSPPSIQTGTTGDIVKSASEWLETTRGDVQAFAEAARENYIYAAYPEPAEWRTGFDRTLAEVEATLPLVRDAAGYQAVLRYMGATFRDAHVSTQFTMPPVAARWPGFLVRFDNGRYRVTSSRLKGVADGEALTACDGKPVSQWIDTIAHYEVATPAALETTRMTAALRLLLDRASPLRARPSQCFIGGREVTLDWQAAPLEELQPDIVSWQGGREGEVSTRMIGADGAWVTLGYFDPADADQASAFHAAIAAAPSLREKRFIILDVRGNGGGPYNWFMGYLRGLYGAAYADHYATARLRIRAVYRLSPAYVALDDESLAQEDALNTPADLPYEGGTASNDAALARAKAAGEAIFKAAPIAIERGAPPANPVRAKVYVLTDYGCASACIGLVDELKLFPGVDQIGLPTRVDSRSGTSVEIDLPSGLATAYIAAMTRDGRERDDNVPQVPSIRFNGDIRDDQAVERWIIDEVVGRRPQAANR